MELIGFKNGRTEYIQSSSGMQMRYRTATRSTGQVQGSYKGYRADGQLQGVQGGYRVATRGTGWVQGSYKGYRAGTGQLQGVQGRYRAATRGTGQVQG